MSRATSSFWSRNYEVVDSSCVEGIGRGNGSRVRSRGISKTMESEDGTETRSFPGHPSAGEEVDVDYYYYHYYEALVEDAWLLPRDAFGRRGQLNRRSGLMIQMPTDLAGQNLLLGCSTMKGTRTMSRPMSPSSLGEVESQRLLVPRHRCVLRDREGHEGLPGFVVVTSKPSYLLLWKYETRHMSRSSDHPAAELSWVSVQCQFVPVKWFGTDFEKCHTENLLAHKIFILDQLGAVRTMADARNLSWCLVGCLETILKELEIECPTICRIPSGEFAGFPEATLQGESCVILDAVGQVLDRHAFQPVHFFNLK